MASKFRKCKICRTRCEVGAGIVNGLDFVCGVEHLAELGLQRAQKQREQQDKAKAKQERAALKVRKDKLKGLREYLAEAQAVFNRWVRLRDHNKPCPSCGAPPPATNKPGGTRDAGHYRSVGACSALRFDEANVHAQCVPCNQHRSGNILEYRIGLRARIGDVELERLETTNPLRRWTIDEAKAIKAEYQQKIKALAAHE